MFFTHLPPEHVFYLLPSINESRAFTDPSIYEIKNRLKMRSMVLRSVSRGPVEGVADLHLADLLDHAVDEHVVNRVFDEQSSGGDAVLALKMTESVQVRNSTRVCPPVLWVCRSVRFSVTLWVRGKKLDGSCRHVQETRTIFGNEKS